MSSMPRQEDQLRSVLKYTRLLQSHLRARVDKHMMTSLLQMDLQERADDPRRINDQNASTYDNIPSRSESKNDGVSMIFRTRSEPKRAINRSMVSHMWCMRSMSIAISSVLSHSRRSKSASVPRVGVSGRSLNVWANILPASSGDPTSSVNVSTAFPMFSIFTV